MARTDLVWRIKAVESDSTVSLVETRCHDRAPPERTSSDARASWLGQDLQRQVLRTASRQEVDRGMEIDFGAESKVNCDTRLVAGPL